MIAFSPSAATSRSAYLVITSIDSTFPRQFVPLSGTGEASGSVGTGMISVSPAALNFPIAGLTEDVTLTNSGNSPVAILGVTSVADSDNWQAVAAPFVVTNNCGTSLAAQSICTISVRLGATDLSGTLTVSTDAPSGSPVIPLKSTNSLFYPYNVSPEVGDFGSWGLNVTSPTKFFYFGYYGYSSGHELNEEFQVGPITGRDAGDFLMPPLGSFPTSASIAFKPTGTGLRTAQLPFINATTGAMIGYIPLTGTGLAPGAYFTLTQPYISGGILDAFNTPISTTGTADISNQGTTTLNLTYSVSGPNAGNFSVSQGTCAALAPAAICQPAIHFNATAAGTYNALLTATDTASSYSQTISIPPLAVTYKLPLVFPVSISFSTQPVGTTSAPTSFVITDDSGTPLGHPLSLSLPVSGAFTFPQGNTCPASTTAACTLSIAFSPKTSGSYTDSFTLTDLTSGYTFAVPVSGTAGAPALSLSSTSVTFPSRSVGTTSLPQTVTLTNTGSEPLTVSSVSLLGNGTMNFVESSTCTGPTIAPNGTCSINISYSPIAAGTQSATIQILSNAASSPDMILVSGTAN